MYFALDLAAHHLPCNLPDACIHLAFHGLGVSLELLTAQVGDHVVVDGGMVTLDVLEKAGPDVRCQVADPGIILSRANLTFRRDGVIVRARNSMLPVLSSKVWSLLYKHTLDFDHCKTLDQQACVTETLSNSCKQLVNNTVIYN